MTPLLLLLPHLLQLLNVLANGSGPTPWPTVPPPPLALCRLLCTWLVNTRFFVILFNWGVVTIPLPRPSGGSRYFCTRDAHSPQIKERICC